MQSSINYEPKTSRYPYLGILEVELNEPNPLIVLFTDYRTGVKVSGDYIGEFSTAWDPTRFVAFEGTVTLSN